MIHDSNNKRLFQLFAVCERIYVSQEVVEERVPHFELQRNVTHGPVHGEIVHRIQFQQIFCHF